MKITLAQLNPTVGDLNGNFALIKRAVRRAIKDRVELIIFPELFTTAYPPRDLLDRSEFISAVEQINAKIVRWSKQAPRIGILIGTLSKHDGELYNSALLIQAGKITGQQDKALLPAYDVFDETRYFTPAKTIKIMPFKNEILGVSICEDMWNVKDLPIKKHYDINPIDLLAKQGATILINLSASPFNIGKDKVRYQIIKEHAQKYKLPFIYLNQVGGNDELIFDGGSMVINPRGLLITRLPSFEETIRTINLVRVKDGQRFQPLEKIESVYQALILGLKDYLEKTGFKKVVLGLSGGIDSAVTAALAVRALGKENVLGVTMPSMFSSSGSVDYSEKLAKNLGIKIKKISIAQIYRSYLEELKEHFAGRPFDVAEENIQARIRGNLLMALSNKFGYLVLSTGNKSELAVGYCTLYGDMSGGLAVIADVPKTMVYQLAAYLNKDKEIIPREIIKVAPSAELRPNQKDQDTLPPYPILDAILQLYIDQNYAAREIINQGFTPRTVEWVIKAVNRNEYKRRQAALGFKITTKAFGMGRRMPIAAKYDF